MLNFPNTIEKGKAGDKYWGESISKTDTDRDR